MLTPADAIAQGYTLNLHASGRPIAYRGPRFAPTAVVRVFTAHECELRAALSAIASMPGDVGEFARLTLDRTPAR